MPGSLSFIAMRTRRKSSVAPKPKDPNTRLASNVMSADWKREEGPSSEVIAFRTSCDEWSEAKRSGLLVITVGNILLSLRSNLTRVVGGGRECFGFISRC